MFRSLVLFLVGFLFSQSAFAMCSQCKAIAEENDGGWANGLNSGILFLMIPPYLLLIAIVLLGFKGKIRAGLKNFVNS
ncbi:MAG: hypothetical protein CMP67_08365 [Flavobacteriales bacterium]|nr:hypothetical protein [Flavobacteriales bacterium]MBO72329.1 hypothetical protein [Flavobacteriales bacterium]|tara:strand:+ start:1136 stop:1369 length:234 start_codon:yes stop_codon:yes gene_type:complete